MDTLKIEGKGEVGDICKGLVRQVPCREALSLFVFENQINNCSSLSCLLRTGEVGENIILRTDLSLVLTT